MIGENYNQNLKTTLNGQGTTMETSIEQNQVHDQLYVKYSKSEQKRIVEYFLVNQNNGVKVVELAKYYFISLPTFYNWLKDWRDGRYIEDSIYNTTIAFRRSK